MLKSPGRALRPALLNIQQYRNSAEGPMPLTKGACSDPHELPARLQMFSLREELTLQCPGSPVGIQYFTEPMKGVWRDFGKRPFSWGSIGTNSDLNHVLAAPAANLILPVVMNRIAPNDSPRLNGRIPYAQRGAKHVLFSV